MGTNAKVGFGAILNKWVATPSPGAWTEIMEVTSISWAGATRETVDVYVLNASDDYVNKIQGVLNAGSVTATVLFTRAGFTLLKADLETRGDEEYQIVLPDGEGLEFAGFVSELPLEITSDDVMQGDVVFQINGKADFVSVATTAAP